VNYIIGMAKKINLLNKKVILSVALLIYLGGYFIVPMYKKRLILQERSEVRVILSDFYKMKYRVPYSFRELEESSNLNNSIIDKYENRLTFQQDHVVLKYDSWFSIPEYSYYLRTKVDQKRKERNSEFIYPSE